MNTGRILFWTPRALAILVILFTSLFALDVFTEDARLVDILVGLVIHLIPQFLMLIALIMSWKRPRAGSIAFILLGLLAVAFFSQPLNSPAHLIITLPMFVIGGLLALEVRFSPNLAEQSDKNE
jgi:hypothetical protein